MLDEFGGGEWNFDCKEVKFVCQEEGRKRRGRKEAGKCGDGCSFLGVDEAVWE